MSEEGKDDDRGREDELARLCREGNFEAAATLAIRTHGPGILGLLVALAPDEAAAADAYSLLCERIWKGLPQFRFESSIRTWAYVLGRRALIDIHRARGRGPKLVAAGSRLPEAVEHVRSETRSYLKTARKAQLSELRAALSEDEQLLLILRIDRSMAWDEIARVLSDDSEPDAAALKRTSASLRKRFERAKLKLKQAMLAKHGDAGA